MSIITDVNSGLSQAEAQRLLAYDPETGSLTWRMPGLGRGAVGRQAGSFSPGGYRDVHIHGRNYKVHRLIWLYVHGRWPTHEIDHKNGDRADNRLTNLREATRRQNTHNIRLRNDSRSGVKGVGWHAQAKKWQAKIRGTHIGLFTDINEAAEAYRVAAERHYGEFARRA